MACARCGCGVYQSDDTICLNKLWHKCCFTCRICREKLDRCSAKVYQGEIYCEKCYNIIVDGIYPIARCSQAKPCRVVSSPSSICIPKNNKAILPNSGYKRAYNIWFPENSKIKSVRSCSCIPEIKKAYCFPYQIPTTCCKRNFGENCRTNKASCCKDYHSKCCPRKHTMRVKIRKMSPPKAAYQSPRTFKENCQETCRCQDCNSNSLSSKCCPTAKCYPSPKCCSPPKYCPSPNCYSPNKCCIPSKCCSPNPKYCPPLPKCFSTRQKECFCSCSPQDSCCPPNPGKCQETPTTCCTPEKQEYCSNLKKPCQPQKCCCKLCIPKLCPETKHCFNNCSSSSARYCTPVKRSPCEIYCLNDCLKCSCSPNQKCFSFSKKLPKYCVCGNLNPCKCKMGQVRAECQSLCVRCGQKVYAAEKIIVTSGSYHNSCFSCYCCRKLLDLRNVQEHCNEIYCKSCYNNFFGLQYYGYGSS